MCRKNYSKLSAILIYIVLLIAVLSACNSKLPSQSVETPTLTPVEAEQADADTDQEKDHENTPKPVAVPLNQHQQSEYYSPILGLCEDYPRGTSVETVERDFALMQEYGIGDIRISIAWGDYESVPGKFNWTLLDKIVELSEQYNIELYPYICYAPTWATVEPDWKYPPKDMQDWYDFVYTVVERYKGKINNWELWNEGDNRDFWLGTWSEQLELVKIGAKAVKEANPDARTIFGGLTKLELMHVSTIYTSGAAEYIDVINIHYYNETWSSSPTESIYDTTKIVASIIKKNGGKQELWIAEIGYSDYIQEDGQVSYQYSVRAPYEKTKEFQAVTFLRSYARIAATEEVSTILWYEVKNLRLDSVAIGDVNNYFLGALDHNYFPKHLWFAISGAKQLFAEPYKSIDRELMIDHETNMESYVHAFQRENGDVILAAWNRGSNKDTIKVTLPGTFQKGIHYSITGEKEVIEFETQSNTTMELTLEPDNINLIELIAEEAPARLTLKNTELTKQSDGTYLVSAIAKNIGDQAAYNFIADLVVNAAFETEETKLKISLEPGEEKSITWSIKGADSSEDPQLWVTLNHDSSPVVASLLELLNK